MIKCRVDDCVEIVVSVDIDGLPEEDQMYLIKQTAALAMDYAKRLGHSVSKSKIWETVE